MSGNISTQGVQLQLRAGRVLLNAPSSESRRSGPRIGLANREGKICGGPVPWTAGRLRQLHLLL